MEPLPDPSSLSAIDRVRIINQMRDEQNRGIEHDEHVLNWMLTLLRLERQSSTSRGSSSRSSSSSTSAKPAVVPTKLEDL